MLAGAREEIEAEVEAERYRSYREVLTESARRIARRLGWALPEAKAGFLAESLPRWIPFPDTNPALERLFRRTDMAAQRKILMQTLTVVVKSLDKLDQIVPAVQALGRRHAGYGVREAHYTTVGEALLWTLEQGLGEAFTTDVRAAWTTAYGTLATVMIEAARTEAQVAAEAAA